MDYQEQVQTVAEVWDWAHRPENADKRFELIEGELFEMSPPGGIHGRIASKLSFFIELYLQSHPEVSGIVTVETGFYPPDAPGILLSPDVAFISHARAPQPFPDGYVSVLPDLVIEVVSPNDSLSQTRRKAAIYLQNGTRLVWIVQPKEGGVDVCRSAQGRTLNMEFVDREGVLSGEQVLPGFALKVADIFAL